MGGQVVVEEGDSHRQDDQVGDEEDQHEQIPIEPGRWRVRVKVKVTVRAREIERETYETDREIRERYIDIGDYREMRKRLSERDT